ncbi:SDR family oxidoreductase [Sphingomonas kyeonggiensis]|uniref:Nucleoside-diphosphate-sugar epimerase n=1 Tax=Sphingomonas kyeonggiensis TaxID=1268553 RepID=A0A7W6JTT4_9SPHN|nr:aldehyde reductase [Sphingomonas kyeonggiensis]MBB4099355.1 nucleoside-diphosphate-sugar epimerase [Sphingomonas kyeonggiensis]
MIPKCVLVTGGSGFVAGHCILQLLEQGHFVRSTLRSLAKEAMVRDILQNAGMVHSDRLSFVAADLLRDDGWTKAMAGMNVVLHVASPVQPGQVASEDEVIIPAREGTLRVLRAARAAGVKRVVLTSAFHAVSWGHPHDGHMFTEADWTILDGPGVDAYGKSKTLAERAAWDFIATEGGGLELTTMLPVAVMGPVMGKDVSGANHIVQRMLEGAMPVVPNLFIPVVDVRDVASAHVMAMTNPAAAGERFLLSNGRALSLKEIGAIIRAALGDAARRVPMRALPNFLVRIAARFNTEMRPFVPDLGYAKKTSNDKAQRVLGWTPREPREAIIAAATSLAGRTG